MILPLGIQPRSRESVTAKLPSFALSEVVTPTP
jgi:hypothetical protein